MMAMGKAGVAMGSIVEHLNAGSHKVQTGGEKYSQTAANTVESKIGIK